MVSWYEQAVLNCTFRTLKRLQRIAIGMMRKMKPTRQSSAAIGTISACFLVCIIAAGMIGSSRVHAHSLEWSGSAQHITAAGNHFTYGIDCSVFGTVIRGFGMDQAIDHATCG